MIRILTLVAVIMFTLSNAFAYTQTELHVKKTTYKQVIKSKIGAKLENIPEVKLREIVVLVDGLIIKYENQKDITNTQKLQKIAILEAFKEIVNEKLENEFSDITSIINTVNKKIEIIIINDERCGESCNTEQLINQLKQIPSLGDAHFIEIDYSEDIAKKALSSAGITYLPAAIFQDNDINQLSSFLKATKDFKYSLELGSTYDPTVSRSDKGFMMLNDADMKKALKNSHFTGAQNGKIVLIEYTDVNCHYCKKMETDGTTKTIFAKFPNDVKKSSVNFIGVGGNKTQIAAEVLECIAKVGGANPYNASLSKSLLTGNNDETSLYAFAKESGVDAKKVEACFKAGTTKEIVASKFEAGRSIFNVTGTPGNVIINIETGEYELISGAYPSSSFIEVIQRLLK